MAEYVAYYRVSNDKQGLKGLGLDARGETVSRFRAQRRLRLAAQFIEVGSRRKDNRPQFQAALAECRKRRAVRVIAKARAACRPARNAHFISGLMKSDVKFVAVDMPSANRLTKARGTKLGKPQCNVQRMPQHSSEPLNQSDATARSPEIDDRLVRESGGLRDITRNLNRLNIRTSTGQPVVCQHRQKLQR